MHLLIIFGCVQLQFEHIWHISEKAIRIRSSTNELSEVNLSYFQLQLSSDEQPLGYRKYFEWNSIKSFWPFNVTKFWGVRRSSVDSALVINVVACYELLRNCWEFLWTRPLRNGEGWWRQCASKIPHCF